MRSRARAGVYRRLGKGALVVAVSARSSRHWDDRLELDTRHVEAYTPWLEFTILFKPAGNMIRRLDAADTPAQVQVVAACPSAGRSAMKCLSPRAPSVA